MAWVNAVIPDFTTGTITGDITNISTVVNPQSKQATESDYFPNFSYAITFKQIDYVNIEVDSRIIIYGDSNLGLSIRRSSGGFILIEYTHYSGGVMTEWRVLHQWSRSAIMNYSSRVHTTSLFFTINEETHHGTIISYSIDFITGYASRIDHIIDYAVELTDTELAYNIIQSQIPITYNWQSVPSISGKNGILSLFQLNQQTDGQAVTGASSDVFFAMPEECNIKKLYPNVVLGHEQIIAYSGINELSVRYDSSTSLFFRFTIYDENGDYDWSYGYSFSLNNASDQVYIMLLTDVREDQTRLFRPSFVVRHLLNNYSYNLETISDENAERLYDWFVLNYNGVSIFGPPNEPAGGGGSVPLNDEPVSQPTLNNNKNAINTGFTRMYWLDDAIQLNEFASWMADPDRIWDKLWETDPLQGIIEVAICPIFFFNRQDDFFHTTIKIFGQDTEIAAERLSSQFFRLDCGTYEFTTQCGDTYLDYSPYTSIKVFLPYIGVIELNTNDVMKREIKLEYTFDILWGVCIAHIYVKNDDGDWSLHYERHGQYLINIPITKADRGEEAAAIKGALSRLAAAVGGVAGFALGGGAVESMSPTQAAGTGSGIVGGGFSTALNVMTSHPQVSYSDGSAGGLSGYMGADEPYIMIEHVITARPEHDELYSGMPCYITGDVGDFENYNKFVDVHLESIPCTKKEQDEIYSWLTNGVIIKTGSSTPDDEPVTQGNSLLIFLKMTSENNVIGKTFGNKKVLEGKLIYDTSIEEPKFLVDGDIREYNYVYIPIFKRFYYIEDIILRRQMLQEISMKVDVLQSFKTQIRACSGIPMRSGDSDKINYYINDGAIIAQQNTRIITQKFVKGAAHFSFDKTAAGYLLTVADANLST